MAKALLKRSEDGKAPFAPGEEEDDILEPVKNADRASKKGL